MDLSVKKKFESYPQNISALLENIRAQIMLAAEESGVGKIEETLKWGEPSYLAKGGSAIRFDWKSRAPDQYGIYFNCNTILVETFKELYGDIFSYESNRAIIFQLNDVVPVQELRHCFGLSLRYHKLKHFPLLGA
jgi:hypothetical protein